VATYDEVLPFLRSFASQAARVIKFCAGLQNPTRKELVDKLQGICSRSEDSYSFVLSKLRPVRDAYGDRTRLVQALRDFANDKNIRKKFKPEQLCGEADYILDKLANNLNPLKYSVPLGKINRLKHTMAQFQNYDGAIRDSFDLFARTLNYHADALANPQLQKDDVQERVLEIASDIEEFEDQLSNTVNEMGHIKDKYFQ
jgi:hypothetical protein